MVNYFPFLILFILGSLSFSMKCKHLLLMLLSLEFLVLSLFVGLFFLILIYYYVNIIFLQFMLVLEYKKEL